MNAGQNKYVNNKVVNVVMHYRPHLDEIFGVWLLKRFGEEVFPGVEQADLQFIKEFSGYWENDIYVGIGGGDFDEHRPDGRLQNTCAAMLVAQRLRVMDKDGVKPVLREVLWCDTHAAVNSTQLASLIKAMHRTKNGKDQISTYLWSSDAIDALVFRRPDSRVDIRNLWKEYIQSERLSVDDPAIKNVEAAIGRSFASRDAKVTELAAIVSRLPKRLLYMWCEATFKMMVADARLYQGACVEVEANMEVFDIQASNGLEPLGYIVSDNEMVTRAANSTRQGKMAITIVVNSNGQVCIGSDRNRINLLEWFVPMLRMAEYRVQKGMPLSIRDAHGLGTSEKCPWWHIPHENAALNGSLSHQGVPPSKLSKTDFVGIAKAAFTKSGRDIWMANYTGRQTIDPFIGVSIGAEIDATQKSA